MSWIIHIPLSGKLAFVLGKNSKTNAWEPNLTRNSFMVLVFCICSASLYGQQDSLVEEYKLELKGRGQSLVDEVRKKNGILAAPSFAKGLADKLIGGSFEDSPVDFLIARDFSVIDSTLIEMRVDSEKPVVVVIYRKSYIEANPQLLEHIIRNVATNGIFSFKVSREDFIQPASVYVLGGGRLQIFDVCKAEGKFGVYKRDEASV